ncbi:hypothetical protein L6452_01125 [Arctium lappa]|uniref:Uncharacterized protein n=1 Tax=Arctium lappa TaxID=4217 RepID=A0ACB9FH85_ARCLA|nr:hypothetical protein L6452_01125 [Arctium lappa]
MYSWGKSSRALMRAWKWLKFSLLPLVGDFESEEEDDREEEGGDRNSNQPVIQVQEISSNDGSNGGQQQSNEGVENLLKDLTMEDKDVQGPEKKDTRKMQLNLRSGSIAITVESVHDILGLPIGGIDLLDSDDRSFGLKLTKEWRRQFQKMNIRPTYIMNLILQSDNTDFMFKMNFLVLFVNLMADCNSMGSCSLSFIAKLKNESMIMLFFNCIACYAQVHVMLKGMFCTWECHAQHNHQQQAQNGINKTDPNSLEYRASAQKRDHRARERRIWFTPYKGQVQSKKTICQRRMQQDSPYSSSRHGKARIYKIPGHSDEAVAECQRGSRKVAGKCNIQVSK